MAKNLTKSKKQPMAMSKDVKNMEQMARSGNVAGSAYDMPLENNMKRDRMMHMGSMPMKNPNGLE